MAESNCDTLREELQKIKALKLEFDAALSESVKTGDPQTPTELKRQIEEKTAGIKDKLWPFEKLSRFELQQQYETQTRALATAKVVERLSSGQIGIEGIDGVDYPLPDFEAVVSAIRESPERLRTKIEQGFSKIVLVPFGQGLDQLSARYGEAILLHHQEGKLFATKKDPSDPDEALELDEGTPLYRWSEYNDADRNEKLKYYPKEFSANHQGLSKRILLEQNRTSKTPGWQVLLMEDLPNIPRPGQGKTVGSRPQLETNKSSRQYLATLQQEPTYKEEVGMTPEDWLAYAITHLETTNQVVDDHHGNGSATFLIGAYFHAAGYVPYGCWYRDFQRAYLDGYSPDRQNGIIGARSAVRVT